MSDRQHVDTDALSRCALPASEYTLLSHDDMLALSAYDAVSFATEQHKDPECLVLIQPLNGSDLTKYIRKYRHFFLLGGFLHMKNYSSNGAQSLIVVPTRLQKEVLLSLYDDPTAGHLGFFKKHVWIRRRYFWPRLYLVLYAAC